MGWNDLENQEVLQVHPQDPVKHLREGNTTPGLSVEFVQPWHWRPPVSMETTHAASEGGSAWSGQAAREGAGASIGVPRVIEGLPRAPDKRGELGESQYALSPRHSCIPELVLTSRQVVGGHTRR